MRTHAILLAVVSWSVVLFSVSSSGAYTRFGSLKWADFPHFYAMGSIVRSGPAVALYDAFAMHQRQTELVPESENDLFEVGGQPAPYSPLVAAVFAPLTPLPYVVAGAVWSTASVLMLLGIGLLVTRRETAGRIDVVLVTSAVLAFPPTWSLFAHGQTSILIVFAFALSWFALTSGRKFLAGVCLGLVIVKPQFGLLVPLVLAGSGEWAMISGATVSVVAQALIELALLGPSTMVSYVSSTLHALQAVSAPEIKPELQHSIRVMAVALAEPWRSLVLVLTSGAVAIGVLLLWRRSSNASLRMAVLVLGSVLVNPHLYIYDATVLVLAAPWLGSVFNGDADWLWRRTYVLTLLFAIPTRAVIPIQGTVIALLELGWQVFRRAHEQ